ncbi:uncharacterized protein TNCV_4451031 [Trichonephila clavipes]|nr:uncharacterized protein TNCV_4451031 [Trichonephila clavipes]
MVREDTVAPNEGVTCAWMEADEAVGCTHAFLTMWRSSRRLVCRGRPEPGFPVNDMSRIHWSQHLLITQSDEMKENFIYNQLNGLYSICYSLNLHSDGNAEPEKWAINSSKRGSRNMIDYIALQVTNNESFLYKNFPKVIFSVHSPFVRDNPHILQNELKSGHRYEIDVRLNKGKTPLRVKEDIQDVSSELGNEG